MKKNSFASFVENFATAPNTPQHDPPRPTSQEVKGSAAKNKNKKKWEKCNSDDGKSSKHEKNMELVITPPRRNSSASPSFGTSSSGTPSTSGKPIEIRKKTIPRSNDEHFEYSKHLRGSAGMLLRPLERKTEIANQASHHHSEGRHRSKRDSEDDPLRGTTTGRSDSSVQRSGNVTLKELRFFGSFHFI